MHHVEAQTGSLQRHDHDADARLLLEVAKGNVPLLYIHCAVQTAEREASRSVNVFIGIVVGIVVGGVPMSVMFRRCRGGGRHNNKRSE